MNITSMTDLVFMLLFVFVIAAPLMHAEVDVKLPKSSAARTRDETAIVVTVTKEGEIYIGKTLVALDDFPDRLKKMVEAGRITSISLKGDEGVNYGLVMKVVGYIKEAGIEDLGLIATPEKKRK